MESNPSQPAEEGQAIRQLADEIFRERIARERRMTFDEKLLGGGELFAEVCQRMKMGLRHEFPNADEREIHRLLVERINRLRRVDESTWITTNPLPPSSTH